MPRTPTHPRLATTLTTILTVARATLLAGALAAGAVLAPPARAQAPAEGARACPQLVGWRLVPEAVIADAMANPAHYGGWMQPNNPSLAPGPSNPLRVYLSIMAPGKPFHPLFNTVIWKAGCL